MKAIARVQIVNTQAAIEALEKDGAVIVSDFTTIEDLEQVNKDMQNYWVDADKVSPRSFVLLSGLELLLSSGHMHAHVAPH